MITVYLITNISEGKYYVGRTSQLLRSRLLTHFGKAKAGGGCPLLSEAIKRCGRTNFSIQPIATFEDKNQAKRFEETMILLFGTRSGELGYNVALGDHGYSWPEHSREKYSIAMRGNKRCVGHKRSEESKAKTSASLKGHSVPPEVREKIRQSLLRRLATK